MLWLVQTATQVQFPFPETKQKLCISKIGRDEKRPRHCSSLFMTDISLDQLKKEKKNL